MNMEELTKSQIVLLTLLVSFVTSIATGIVTVSLMQQAPPAITQSVLRVIQQTVQTVTPASGAQHAAASVTQEKTVVVSESDLISKAVERVSPSIVRIYASTAESPEFLSLGVVLDGRGTVATDLSALDGNSETHIVLQDGSSLHATVQERDALSGLAFLEPATSSAPSPHWTPAVVASGHVTLGQSVVALSGKTQPRIASGLIVALLPGTEASSSARVIETDINPESVLPGSPLIDTQGALVGISTEPVRATSPSDFFSAVALMALLLNLPLTY